MFGNDNDENMTNQPMVVDTARYYKSGFNDGKRESNGSWALGLGLGIGLFYLIDRLADKRSRRYEDK